ncbi:MAG: hypothetical protein WCI51_13565 [Lentisphaerota bacterium]
MKKRILKITAWSFIAVAIIIIAAYFFLTSSFFLAGILLPYVSRNIGCEIKAEAVNLSLIKSRIEISRLKVGPEKKLFASADTFKAAFSLSAIINGNIKVEDIILDNVAVNLNKNASGDLELPFAQSPVKTEQKVEPKVEPKAAKPGETPFSKIKLDISNARISNLNFTLTEEKSQGVPTKLSLSGLNIDIPLLKTGAGSKIKMKGNISISSGNDLSITAGVIENNIEMVLNESFLCDKLNMQLNISAVKGRVNNVSLDENSLTILLDASGDLDTINIDNLTVRQTRGGLVSTDIQIKSTIDINPLKISATVKMKPVSEELVSILFDFIGGYNPGRIGLAYFGQLDYNGSKLSSKGNLGLERSGNAMILGKAYELPPFGFTMSHDITADLNRKEVNLNKLSASLLEKSRSVLDLKLMTPSAYCWDDNRGGFNGTPPEINLHISDLNLKTAQLFLPVEPGIKILDGRLNADIDASAGKINDAIEIRARIAVANLDMNVPGMQFRDLNFNQSSRLFIEKFKNIRVEQFALLLCKGKSRLAGLTLNGGLDLDTMKTNVIFKLSDISSSTIEGLPLSTEVRKIILSNLNKIAPLSAEIAGRFDASLKQMTMNLGALSVNLSQNSRKTLSVDLTQSGINLKDMPGFVNSPPVMNVEINQLGLTQFNGFMKASGNEFNAGNLSGKLKVKFTDKFSRMAVAGDFGISNVDLSLPGNKRYQNVTINQAVDLQMVNYNELKIASHSAEILVNRQKALRFDDSGVVNIGQGDMMLNANIVYLNKNMVNLFYASELTELDLNGKLNIEASDKFQAFQVKGNVNIDKLYSRKITSPVSGQAVINIQKQDGMLNFRRVSLELLNEGKTAIQAAVDGQTPEKGGRTIINLSSAKIDALLIQRLCATSAAGKKPAEPVAAKKKTGKANNAPPKTEKQEPASFNFGNNEIVLTLNLKGITYGPEINAGVAGRIVAVDNMLDIGPMNIVINDSPVNFKSRLVSNRDGISYSVTGNIKELNIHPLMQPFVEGNMRNIEATVEALDMDIKGVGVDGPELWDNMDGQSNITLRNISIPNEFGQTTIGRIIIIPFEVLSKLQGMNLNLKPDSGKKTNDAFSFVNNFYKSTETIRLNTGNAQIIAQNRRIYVNKCEFKGDMINDLTIKGYAGLGTDRGLDVNSKLTMSQLSAPVHITGTVDNPQYNIKDTVAAFLKDNALNLLNAGTELLKDGGKGLESVLSKTIDVIANPQSVDGSTTNSDSSSSNTSSSKSKSTKTDSAKALEQGVKKVFDSLFN